VDDLELEPHAVAVGGDAVARAADGRVVFVTGALPGELVVARVTEERDRFLRADAIDVRRASPDRVVPSCPHVADGCGGCGFAHVAPAAQVAAKVVMVTDALERIGRLSGPVVVAGPSLDPLGARTTVRAGVVAGRGGLRRARSHDHLAVTSCEVSHPALAEMLVDGRFGTAREVTLRVGARTGERLALIDPTAVDVALPADVLVVGADELRAGRRAWIHEEVAGHTWRISADAFFQTRPDGAEALVDLVGDALADVAPDAPVADLYAGVGLFAGTVGRGHPVVAVERSRASVADARVNLAGGDVRIVRAAVERWRPSPARAVVADPARSGLGRHGVAAVNGTGATHLALVSCDAGSLGRDAALLGAAGWVLERATVVDLFPQTPHVEVVSRFVRG